MSNRQRPTRRPPAQGQQLKFRGSTFDGRKTIELGRVVRLIQPGEKWSERYDCVVEFPSDACGLNTSKPIYIMLNSAQAIPSPGSKE